MSGGEIVGTRGGIDVRTDDLRAAARILSEVGSTVRQHIDELITASNARLMYDSAQQADLRAGAAARARAAADDAARMAQSLRDTAGRYDERESWIERMAGDLVAVAGNGTKSYLRTVSGGWLDTPWDWDPRAIEVAAMALDATGFGTVLAAWAAILDWTHPPVVASTGVDRSRAGTTPPRSTRDLLEDVARLESSDDSDISVQFLEYDDGCPRQVIVSLPGTSQWTPGSDIPTDVTAGALAITGRPTAYSAGVIEILELAGVTAADRILLVGHSLGGMVAAQVASQLSASGRYTVTNVVTAGAPIARIDIPDEVEAIALENKEDIVPYLDRGPNEQSGNVLTVTVDTGETGTDAHSIGTGYAPAADAVDASGNLRIQHALEGLEPFLAADRTTTSTYSIARG